jgi:hypothetical protein
MFGTSSYLSSVTSAAELYNTCLECDPLVHLMTDYRLHFEGMDIAKLHSIIKLINKQSVKIQTKIPLETESYSHPDSPWSLGWLRSRAPLLGPFSVICNL